MSIKPTATATIDPIGLRTSTPREYLIKVAVPVEEQGLVKDLARRVRAALDAYGPADGDRDRRDVREMTARRKGKGGVMTIIVVGVEASVVSAGRPPDDVIEELKVNLGADGYRVVVRERRECAHALCSTDTVIDWNQAEAPARWFSTHICGKHDYKSCARCKSVYLLTSMNAAGQAPSVHCEVCGIVLVEWGSSKVWNAELVQRGNTPAAPPPS